MHTLALSQGQAGWVIKNTICVLAYPWRRLCLLPEVCCTGGVIGDKCRRGYPREHWIDQVTKVAWNTLAIENHTVTRDATISVPHCYLQVRNIALDRHYWGHIVSVPTHIVADVEDHTVTFFSQTSQDGYECSA